jgi:hypothetical protein
MSEHPNKEQWKGLAEKQLKGKPVSGLDWKTPEEITVSPLYTAEDVAGLAHANTLPGMAPYVRGPMATMYAGRPWTIRQYAGFSTAKESNAFYRRNLAAGQKGLSVAFDLATHRGCDSDHPRVRGDVEKAGVAIDSVEDMKILFDQIPKKPQVEHAADPCADLGLEPDGAGSVQQHHPYHHRGPGRGPGRDPVTAHELFDEAVGLPTDFSARIARNTQIILQEESQICRVVDPLGGSYYIESLTGEIIKEARAIIEEVESLGGMAKAIMGGMPKRRIEESAARRQARIDQGKDVIVGVNKYKIDQQPLDEVLEVSEAVRDEQVARLQEVRSRRNAADAASVLEAVSVAAASGGNLLAVSIAAVRARATVGEISDAMEKVFGRYVATTQCISGVYAAAFGDSEVIASLRKRTDDFLAKEGRRPRILLTKMGQDGHDRGVKVVATAYADLDFDVDLSPMFQTPEEAARMAVENDVHVVGVSTLTAGHKTLVPQLIAALKKEGGRISAWWWAE